MPEPEPITGWRRLLNEPQRIAGTVRAVVLAAMAFGFQVTVEQLGVTMLALELVLTEISRAFVTPNQLADARVIAGRSPTEPEKTIGVMKKEDKASQ